MKFLRDSLKFIFSSFKNLIKWVFNKISRLWKRLTIIEQIILSLLILAVLYVGSIGIAILGIAFGGISATFIILIIFIFGLKGFFEWLINFIKRTPRK